MGRCSKHFNQTYPKLELEDVGAVLKHIKKILQPTIFLILNALGFGTDEEFLNTDP